MRSSLAAILLLCSGVCRAQTAADAHLGYVVRADSTAVVLDFTEKDASAGQAFTVFKEGEELKHPATGKPLGRLETPVAEGSLREVLANYSLGTLGQATEPVTAGMRARLKPAAAAAAPAPAAPPAANQQPGSLATARAPRWKGPAFDFQATAFAVADCKGDGKLEAVVSDGRSVFLYPYPPSDAKPIAEFSAPGTAVRILSLEAADLNGNGRAEVFASLFNDAFSRFETKVLELGPDGKLAQVAELPYLVRGYQDAAGAAHLAAQQVTEDASFPFGAIYPLVLRDGKYGPGKPAIDFGKHRVDWLYDFTFGTVDGKPATVNVTGTELIQVRFPKGSWKTAESYCQTPNRVRWPAGSDRLLQFRPAMALRYDGSGLAGLYAVKNIAGFGGLAGPFGLFTKAELQRLDWSGLSLAPSWVAELGGFSTGLANVSVAGRPELAVLVVGTAGRSSIWAFDP